MRGALRSAARLLGLPSTERRRLLEAAVQVTWASVELRVVPASRTVPRLGTLSQGDAAAVSPAQLRDAELIGHDVARVSGRLPWHPTCLRQALAVQRMLRRRGIPGRLHLGVTSARAAAAHAWVTVDGHAVVGHRGIERFVPLAEFG